MYPVARAPRAALGALALLACTAGEMPSASGGLVFVLPVAGSTEIVRARLSDAAQQRVTDTPQREERWPYWSEAAGRLVFQARFSREPHDLFLWDPQSRRETALLRSAGRDERWQAWSPDGGRVVYAFRGGDPPGGLAQVDLDGVVRVLAPSGESDFFLRPSFSPDGGKLVAQRRAEGGRGSQLWLLDGDRAPRPLAADPHWFAYKARFSRDAARVVYSRRLAGGGPSEIVSIELDGGGLHVLAGGDGRDAHSAAPSPARDEIAFVARDEGDYDVYLSQPDGGLRALTRTPERDEFAPRWAPDGELLVVTTQPAGSGGPRLRDPEGLQDTGIAVVDRAGREIFSAPGYMPDWMPPWP